MDAKCVHKLCCLCIMVCNVTKLRSPGTMTLVHKKWKKYTKSQSQKMEYLYKFLIFLHNSFFEEDLLLNSDIFVLLKRGIQVVKLSKNQLTDIGKLNRYTTLEYICNFWNMSKKEPLGDPTSSVWKFFIDFYDFWLKGLIIYLFWLEIC